MLPKVRRLFNNRRTSSADQLSQRNSVSSEEDETNFYTETLLYVVHVSEIVDTNPIDDQPSNNILTRKASKRTIASFNNQQMQTPKSSTSSRPLISFSNPFRRLNNLLKADQKSAQRPSNSSGMNESSFITNPSRLSNRLVPPPPPEFLSDHPVSSRTIRAYGPGLSDGFADQNCYFDLTASDSELERLAIAIDGPSKADIHIQAIEKGIYRVHYKCPTPGRYSISITCDDIHANGSPYHLHLTALSAREELRSSLSSDHLIRATVEPLEFYLNTPSIVHVRPTTACDVFQAFIQTSKEKSNLPIIVHKSTKSELYEIYFMPTVTGYHWLHVYFNYKSMVNNPTRLIVRQNSSMKSMLTTKDELFHAYTGELSQFFVSKSPADRTSKKGNFSVGINGPSAVSLDANENDFGYEFRYKPARSGRYIIAIKNGGKHIPGSPFLCHVDDGSVEKRALSEPVLNSSRPPTTTVDLNRLHSSITGNAAKVCVFGTGLYEARKRRKATFKIDASQAGPGLLLVGLYSSMGSYERLVVKRLKSLSSDFIYKVSYRIRTSGQYLLTILYGSNMQHVPGSPYLVLVE